MSWKVGPDLLFTDMTKEEANVLEAYMERVSLVVVNRAPLHAYS